MDTICGPGEATNRPGVIDDAVEPGFPAKEDSNLLMPALRRLDVYRGIGDRRCGVFRIDTVLQLLAGMPSFFPVSKTLHGRQRTACYPPSPTPGASSSLGFSGSYPSRGSGSDSADSVASLDPTYELSDYTTSRSPSLLPCSEAHDSPLSATTMHAERVLPDSLSFPSLYPLRRRSRQQLPENRDLELPTSACSAGELSVEGTTSTRETPCQLAPLPSLECLVVEAPLPATLIRGLRGRLPRLRHLSVTQLMGFSPESVKRRDHGGQRNRELSNLERLRALRSFLEALPPNQLQSVCVSLSSAPTPECLFNERSPWGGTEQVEGDEDSQPGSVRAWKTLIDRVDKALPPEEESSDTNVDWRTHAPGGLAEDGDEVMELLTAYQAESLESLWFPDIPVSYPILQRFLSRCKKVKSWHIPGWAALMAATLGGSL
ncbi:conserved hypothetical protein [Neospora caninum Liverpool]|nr:conserved hypothetical protein [Neospora caninum Liverpool]CBZ52968.1 conserved hypothetical protein [Neospora caninum Liverpool]|eukprot:XP_003883000.1 conserved hypothetical protein [Neospora caninum Liverpool]